MRELFFMKQINRSIRSFVRRQGRMTPGQKMAVAQRWQQYGLSLKNGPINSLLPRGLPQEPTGDGDSQGEPRAPLESPSRELASRRRNSNRNKYSAPWGGDIYLVQIFGRTAPCYLEIGFGMGGSLLQLATHYPQYDFLGVEVYRPGLGALLAQLEIEQVANVRVFQEDAVEVLQQCVTDHSLTGVLLFFPDPWPKKRHHKRRIIQPEFVQLVAKKLVAGGYFHMATDWQDYAEHMQEVMAHEANYVLMDSATQTEGFLPRPPTKYEARGRRLGHQVWDFVYRLQTTS